MHSILDEANQIGSWCWWNDDVPLLFETLRHELWHTCNYNIILFDDTCILYVSLILFDFLRRLKWLARSFCIHYGIIHFGHKTGLALLFLVMRSKNIHKYFKWSTKYSAISNSKIQKIRKWNMGYMYYKIVMYSMCK